MTQRKDGQETQIRLSKAACAVSAQKGCRKAKVAEICNHADANVAAVNYYFKGKAGLYVETCRYLFQQFQKSVMDVLEDGSPKNRLQQYIQLLLQSHTIERDWGYFIRLYMMELVNPNGLIQDVWHDSFEVIRKNYTIVFAKLSALKRITKACYFAS